MLCWRACLVLLLLAQAPVTTLAQNAPPMAPLSLADVLDSSGTYFPKILEAMARRQVAANEQQAALGAFDLVFNANSYSRATGYYDGNVVGGKATQPLRPLGASVYGQYRLSTGDFPIYEDENYTSRGGQAKLGVLFSLLRDRDIDKRRFGESDARFALRDADFDLLLTQIGVQQRASVAYWKWVAKGRSLTVYEELLRIAERRDAGLRKQIAKGAVARIYLTENQQNITRRQSLVMSAERDFRQAANALALYYRDDKGEPKIAQRQALPQTIAVESASSVPALIDPSRVDDALARRPEVSALRNAIDRAGNRLQLRENALRPRLDVRLELAQGVGGVGEGGESRDATDTTVGLSFSMPLQRREARARLEQARAKLDALRYQRQQLEDQIELEVQDIVLSLRYAEQLARLAELEVEQSQLLQVAEQQRFDSGASDLFLINVREQAVANAKVRAVAARLETQIARANFDAATIDLKRLRLKQVAPLP
jgi:outer membrane protein TolC